MAAETLSSQGISVDVFDAMPSLGRKLLMAGKSGLNLTHAEPYSRFVERFGEAGPWLRPYLDRFTPQDLQDWATGLGVETFVGSSGRVFPTAFKASPLLRAWLKRLGNNGVNFHPRHKWQGWDDDGRLVFDTGNGNARVKADATTFALGGASWPRLGSDGSWIPAFEEAGISVARLKPANCGFKISWSDHFAERFAGEPVKSVSLAHGQSKTKGDFVISKDGIEGSAIYAVSASLRDDLIAGKETVLSVDLKPDLSLAQLTKRLSRPRGKDSQSNFLRKAAGIRGVQAGLIRECLPKNYMDDPVLLAQGIKSLPITVSDTRPIEEAISCAGGVSQHSLDSDLMVKARPGTFCAGEMLDWEAPTGGYLLTACFATGRAAGIGALKWLQGN